MSTALASPLAAVTDVEFLDPIIGFADEPRFRLIGLEDTGVLWSLESLRTDGLRFVVAVPEPFFPTYAPEVDAGVVAPLVESFPPDASDLHLLVILSVTGSITTATANLLAPVILAPSTGRALQVVLSDDTLSLRAPLSPATAR